MYIFIHSTIGAYTCINTYTICNHKRLQLYVLPACILFEQGVPFSQAGTPNEEWEVVMWSCVFIWSSTVDDSGQTLGNLKQSNGLKSLYYTLSRIQTWNTGKVCSSIPFKRVLILPCKTSLLSQICKHFCPTCGMNQLPDSMTRPVSICRTSATCRLTVPHSAVEGWNLVQLENFKADSKLQSYINNTQ